MLAVPIIALTLTACGGAKEAPKAAETKAAPAASAPAAAAAEKPKPAALVIRVDTVYSSKGMTDAEKAALSCVATTHIKPGQTIGWRIKVVDTGTGKVLDNTQIEESGFKITVPGATDVPPIKWADHGGKPPQDAFFSTWWTVPDKQPTGVLPWTISVTAKDGRTAEVKHDVFNIKSSWLTVVEK